MQPIFVGDVQGCADELDEILERAVRGWGSGFELWLVGDLINRGPSNLRVLDRVRELWEAGRARYVLGNHEIAFLGTALGLRRLSHTDTFGDLLAARDLDDWRDWLLARPLVETGVLGEQPFAMVHAAAHPDWSLPELVRRAADVERELAAGPEAARRLLCGDSRRTALPTLERLTTCRSVSGESWSATPPRDGFVAWHEAWSRRNHGYGVVYGHWSLQGLHVADGLRGLDTGCVHHGRNGDRWLTAWIPDTSRAKPFGVPDTGFWKVPARRRYHGSASPRSHARADGSG